MHVYLYVSTYASLYMGVYMSIYVHVYFSLHVCMCIDMFAHIPIINVYMYAYLYVCTYVSTYTCVFAGWEKGKKRKELSRKGGGRVMDCRGDTVWKKKGTWWRGGPGAKSKGNPGAPGELRHSQQTGRQELLFKLACVTRPLGVKEEPAKGRA